METRQFSDRKESVDFYEQRYAHGYMGYWSSFEKNRLIGLIRELQLPETGRFLDFGCGRGIFTSVIREALPGWTGFGCDISSEAIRSAQSNIPGITFFVLGDPAFSNERFDFIHSHHVLEHTFNVEITAGEMSAFAQTSCTMLHSLPCNEPGSLEYRVSMMRKEGFDAVTGKFFFEDPAHLRRLNAKEVLNLFSKSDFKLLKASYANQYYGALKWIAESRLGLLLKFSDPSDAPAATDKKFLSALRLQLLFYWYCHFAATALIPADRGRMYVLKRVLQVISLICFFWLAIPVNQWLLKKAKREWEERRSEANGTDLFIALRR